MKFQRDMHNCHHKGKCQKASTAAKPSCKITVNLHFYQQPIEKGFKRLISCYK